MGKTILTVDDSVSIRQMVSFTLKGGGYEVLQAADGEEGLALARANNVQLIITDQNMPKMDGLTMVRALRATAVHAGRCGLGRVLKQRSSSSARPRTASRRCAGTGL